MDFRREMEREVLKASERQATTDYLREHGAVGPIRIAKQIGDDELVILLEGVTGLNEDRITRDLQSLLSRKVWLVQLSDVWKEVENL